MNFEIFVSKRLASSKSYKNSVSAPIIKIAIVAVILSMIMILIAIATGTGLQSKIRNKITSFAGHITLSNFDNNRSEVTLEPLSIHQPFYPEFSEVPEVVSIHPIATKAGVIRTSETFEGIIFKGVDANYHWSFLEEYLSEGRLPTYEAEGMTNEVIISEYLANRLQVKVGDKIQTYFLKSDENEMPFVRGFEVVGLYMSYISQFDEAFVFGDLKHVQRLNRWDSEQVGAFEVLVSDFEKIELINDEIYSRIPSDINSIPITQKFYNIFEWLKLFDTNIYIILGLMILVASINMIVALLVLIMERTQMIGILKSFGVNNWSIRKLFLFQASYILLHGLFWGNVIGVGLLLLQKHFGIITLDPHQYHVKVAPVNLNVLHILVVNIFFIVLCYLIMLLPSHIITKIKVVDSIKKE